MPKFTLSAPQKLLVGCSIVLFAVTLLLIAYIVFTQWNLDFRRDVYISYSTDYPVINGVEEQRGFSYGQQITLTSGETLIRWGNHTAVLFAPSSFIVTADSIKISQGYAFIKTESPLKIFLSDQQLEISNLSGVYETSLNNFLVTDGELQVNEIEKAVVNQFILFDGAKFTTASFDRAELSNATWQRIINALEQVQLLPESLADIEPPVITAVEPSDEFRTEEENIEITGVTESGVSLEINGNEVSVSSNGQFAFNLVLAVGPNTITLNAIDAVGNQTTQEITIVREQAEDACNFSEFNSQLFCLINDYRISQGVGALTQSTTLTAIAQEQAEWMAENEEVSPKDGDDVTERCQTLNIACQEELIGQSVVPTAENFLDLWISQSNDRLLGDFNQVGIGNQGGYAAIVLN